MNTPIPALVVMGVAGCGKSSVGAALAFANQGRLIEGDTFHPAANIAKMSAGTPLTDDDRADWLIRLGQEMANAVSAGVKPVLTCSALKRKYRDALRSAVPGLGFVFLDLTHADAALRVANRPGHFMPASLVDSQFAALEPPYQEPATFVVDATLPIEIISQQVSDWWAEPISEVKYA
jgi:gluconokinase